jgi:cardiolipin synthase
MVSKDLIAALTEARRRLPSDVWKTLAEDLARSNSVVNSDSAQRALAPLSNPDAAWVLGEAFRGCAERTTWIEIAAAMVAVDQLAGDVRPLIEVIWTGPANNRLPVRRIDQTLYDMISVANRRIVLVTFAAHRVAHLCGHLMNAVNRGVELTLIVESEGESEGQLTLDAIDAFRALPALGRRIFYWPLARRERNQLGRPGKLHAKCAIVDDVVLVGSANLTDDAFNRNMELGVMIRDAPTVALIVEHFEQLIGQGVLMRTEVYP